MLLAKEMGARRLLGKSDSLLVTEHVTGEFQAKDSQMAAYLRYVHDGRGPSTHFHEWQETSQERLDPKARASRPSKTKLGASKTKLEASKTKLGASRTKLGSSRTRRLGSSYQWKKAF